MFTGIIEECGTVRASDIKGKSGSLEIECRTVLENTKEGDSIAVNGVCLTVSKLGAGFFSADVMIETLKRTNLGFLQYGSKVNLERALSVSDRLGGHIVTGHIDGTGVISEIVKEENAFKIVIQTSRQILNLIVEKGSVAIDGISLTVTGVNENEFSVSVIPHTGTHTTLLLKKKGDAVNLENDILGKYVCKFADRFFEKNINKGMEKKEITEAFLIENGF